MTFLTTEELKSIITDPKEIVRLLDQHIIGQTEAKKSLALMLLRRALVGLQKAGNLPTYPVFDKSNVLLIGDTGTGKTALIRALAEINGSPVGLDDVTEITSAGYVGGKVEEILERFVIKCEGWVKENYWKFLPEEIQGDETTTVYPDFNALVQETVENGIVYLDEIDKIRRKGGQGADVTGDCVQNELLKFLENGKVNLWESKKSTTHKGDSNIISVDTTNITFICGGAFDGLQDIIRHRLKKNLGIGFSSDIIITDRDEILSNLKTEDLIEYGFKPEFLGRIPIRTSLSSMTEEMMRDIITKPKNNLYDQYKLVFQMFNIDFSIDDAALSYLAKKALESNIGARSLKQVFTKLLTDVLYNLWSCSDKEFKIGVEYVKERL